MIMARLIWNSLATTTTLTFTLVISTGHVTSWPSLVARCRMIPKRFVMGARIDKRQNRWDDALANFQKASELDPRNDEVAYCIAGVLYVRCAATTSWNSSSRRTPRAALIRDPWTQLGLADAQTGRRVIQSRLRLFSHKCRSSLVRMRGDMDNSIYCSSLPAGLRRGESGDCRYSCEVRRCTSGNLRRVGLTDRLRVRAAISRKRSRCLQPRGNETGRERGTRP